MRSLVTVVALVLVLFGTAVPAMACPFCAPQTTWTEQFNDSPAAFAVQYVSGHDGDLKKGTAGETRVRITQIFRNDVAARQSGETIVLNIYHVGTPGDLFLLTGKPLDNGEVQWNPLFPASLALVEYLANRPAPGTPLTERLAYFLTFFEHPDEAIAVDAYSEFGTAPYADVKSLTPLFSREKLADWVQQPAAGTGRIARLGFYGMLLGLCGNADDARMMERLIVTLPNDPTDFRIGLDGVMAGYLMLTGETGLKRIEQHAFHPDTPDTDRFALHQALRFVWDFGDGCVAKESLRASLRRMIDDPSFAELAIIDLTRWEDLELCDQLVRLLDDPRYQDRYVTTSITRYYLTISQLDPTGKTAEECRVIESARKHLAMLRLRDPDMVARAERAFR